MPTSENSVPEEELPERQRLFLERLRRHDKRVKIIRDGERLSFHGPVIGEGPMPPAEPVVSESAISEPDEADGAS
jgi:hypothetical protein